MAILKIMPRRQIHGRSLTQPSCKHILEKLHSGENFPSNSFCILSLIIDVKRFRSGQAGDTPYPPNSGKLVAMCQLKNEVIAMQWLDPPQRDGFQLTRKIFVLPANPTALDPVTKRKVTVCNLFANYEQSIADIVRLLDEKYQNVVSALLEERLIQERRKEPRESALQSRSFATWH